MADATATFAVNLEDGTSAPAGKAAAALDALKKQISGDEAALKGLEKAFKQLNSAQVVNIKAAQDLRAQIAGRKQAIADAQASYAALGGTYGRVAGQGKPVLSFLEKIREASAAAPGPLNSLTARFGGLANVLRIGAIAVGIVAIAAALAVMVVASIAAVGALARYGVAQADARRNELLRLEGLTKLRFWYGAAAGSARDLQAATDKVSAGVAVGRDQVAKYTEQLYRAGLRGANLETALEAVAIKASVQGDAAANAFAGWAAGTALAGGSVKKLADDVKARLGGIAAAQMLSLDVQTTKLHESFSFLFSGLNLEPLLRGLKQVTDLFSANTESGKALRGLLTRMFQPLINGSEGAGGVVRRLFQGMILAALKTENVILRLRVWLKDTFGSSDFLRGIDTTTIALRAGQIAFGVFAAGALVATAALGSVLLVVGALSAAVYGIGTALLFVGKLVADAFAFDWRGLGNAIVDGLVKGLVAGRRAITNALDDLGKGALKAFKNALGIASPSKEFAKLGLALPQGVEAGVRKGAPAAQDAVDGMLRVPSPTAAETQPAGRAGAAQAPKIAISIGDVIVHAREKDTAKTLAEDIRAAIVREFEGAVLQLGGAL